MQKEFKKANPLTFDCEVKKLEDVEEWSLGMKNIFRIQSYLENLKEKVFTFILKGKEYIWWEDLKNVKCIREEEMS